MCLQNCASLHIIMRQKSVQLDLFCFHVYDSYLQRGAKTLKIGVGSAQTIHRSAQTIHRSAQTIHRSVQTIHRSVQTIHRSVLFRLSTDLFRLSTDLFKLSTDLFKLSTDLFKRLETVHFKYCLYIPSLTRTCKTAGH